MYPNNNHNESHEMFKCLTSCREIQVKREGERESKREEKDRESNKN